MNKIIVIGNPGRDPEMRYTQRPGSYQLQRGQQPQIHYQLLRTAVRQ